MNFMCDIIIMLWGMLDDDVMGKFEWLWKNFDF